MIGVRNGEQKGRREGGWERGEEEERGRIQVVQGEKRRIGKETCYPLYIPLQDMNTSFEYSFLQVSECVQSL